jgi:hypothetical protein
MKHSPEKQAAIDRIIAEVMQRQKEQGDRDVARFYELTGTTPQPLRTLGVPMSKKPARILIEEGRDEFDDSH